MLCCSEFVDLVVLGYSGWWRHNQAMMQWHCVCIYTHFTPPFSWVLWNFCTILYHLDIFKEKKKVLHKLVSQQCLDLKVKIVKSGLLAQGDTLWNRFPGWVQRQRDTCHQIANCSLSSCIWFWFSEFSWWFFLFVCFVCVPRCTPTYKALPGQVLLNTEISATSFNWKPSHGFCWHF